MYFLSQLYLQRMQCVLQEYAQQQKDALEKLKTIQAKERRIQKIHDTMQELVNQGASLPGLVNYVNKLFFQRN